METRVADILPGTEEARASVSPRDLFRAVPSRGNGFDGLHCVLLVVGKQALVCPYRPRAHRLDTGPACRSWVLLSTLRDPRRYRPEGVLPAEVALPGDVLLAEWARAMGGEG